MSQNRGTEDMDGERPPKGLSAEAMQQYLTALAEDRDASMERTEGIVARFFKVAIVMVCLNVVIAGANVAMILIRPRTVTVTAPVPTPPATTPPAPAPPATQIAAEEPSPSPPVLATPAVAAEPGPSVAAAVSPTAAKPSAAPKPAVAPKPAMTPQPEKKVPLLGPLPVSRPAPAGAPMLARRPAKPVGRVMLNKPFLSSDEYEEQDDGRPLGPPERW